MGTVQSKYKEGHDPVLSESDEAFEKIMKSLEETYESLKSYPRPDETQSS